tara:strand:+ start:81 stop:305 length:225 start_codon:yes stop_codon:yes gene_type:complete
VLKVEWLAKEVCPLLGWPSRIEDVADKLEESGLLTKTVRKTFIRTATENWEKFNGVQLGDDFIPPEYGGECEDG